MSDAAIEAPATPEPTFTQWLKTREGNSEPEQEPEQESAAPEAETATEPETVETTQEPVQQEPKQGQKRTLSEERDRLLAEVTQLRKERRTLRDGPETDSNRPATPQVAQAQPPAKDEALLPYPKLSAFDYDEDQYAEAVQKWHDKREQFSESKRQKAQAESQRIAEERRTQERAQQQFAEARKQFPDFDEIVFRSDLPVTSEMAKWLQEEDDGALIAYQLGKNHSDEAQRISALPPHRQASAMARFAGSLSQNSSATPGKPPQKVSAAPTPIRPVAGRAEQAPKPDDMTYSEWLPRRLEQLKRRNR